MDQTMIKLAHEPKKMQKILKFVMLAHNMIEYTYNYLKNDDIIFLVIAFCLSLNKKNNRKNPS